MSEQEATWRLKNRVVWLTIRDENTILFFIILQTAGNMQILYGNCMTWKVIEPVCLNI